MSLEAFKGVSTSTDAQKAALSALIAQQGSQGAEQFKAEAAVAQAAGQAGAAGVQSSNPGIGNPSAASAVGPGKLTQRLSAAAAQPGALGATQGRAAANDFSQYSGLIGQANSNYMDAVKGAAPIVESQTQAQVSQILADLAAKRDAQRQEAEDRQWARQNAMEDQEWQRESRQWAREDRLLELAAKLGNPEAKPLGAAEAGARLGLKPDEAGKITSSVSYGKLMQAAQELVGQYPDMDRTQLAGQLAAVYQNMLYQTTENPDGSQVTSKIAQTDPRALDLVLAQVNSLFPSDQPQYGRNSARRALGLQTVDEARRNVAFRRTRAR